MSLEVKGKLEKTQGQTLPIESVMTLLFSELPENMPLYKDSGLWQLRTDDMEDVIIQQECNDSDEDFFKKCVEMNKA